MPELPEAETIARELHKALACRRFGRVLVVREDVIHGDPRPLASLLTGRRVRRVWRRGKRVILDLSPKSQCVFHLGMSGRLMLTHAKDVPEPHTHLRAALRGDPRELRFCDPRRFGGVWFLANGTKHVGRTLGPLGPEPLELTPAAFARLTARSRQIKALLLDQRAIAGLGNIYTDEALHAAGIHPVTIAADLDAARCRRLLSAIQSTLRRAIRHRGTTLRDYRRPDGTPGDFGRFHRVYQREGCPCQGCGTTIKRIQVAGRSSFFCPCCQEQP